MRGRAMGIGKSKEIAAAFAAALAVSLVCATAAQALDYKTGIWKVMRAGHFSGPMSQGAHVRPVKGSLAANGTRYRFWEYSWLNPETHHGRELLLVFEQAGSGLSYLGYYETDWEDFKGAVHPVIRGKTLFFPYHDIEILGDKRAFATSFENGPPPELIPGSVSKFNR
jgi:hypothetical protein